MAASFYVPNKAFGNALGNAGVKVAEWESAQPSIQAEANDFINSVIGADGGNSSANASVPGQQPNSVPFWAMARGSVEGDPLYDYNPKDFPMLAGVDAYSTYTGVYGLGGKSLMPNANADEQGGAASGTNGSRERAVGGQANSTSNGTYLNALSPSALDRDQQAALSFYLSPKNPGNSGNWSVWLDSGGDVWEKSILELDSNQQPIVLDGRPLTRLSGPVYSPSAEDVADAERLDADQPFNTFIVNSQSEANMLLRSRLGMKKGDQIEPGLLINIPKPSGQVASGVYEGTHVSGEELEREAKAAFSGDGAPLFSIKVVGSLPLAFATRSGYETMNDAAHMAAATDAQDYALENSPENTAPVNEGVKATAGAVAATPGLVSRIIKTPDTATESRIDVYQSTDPLRSNDWRIEVTTYSLNRDADPVPFRPYQEQALMMVNGK